MAKAMAASAKGIFNMPLNAEHLRKVLDEHGFEVAFQPRVIVTTGRLTGFEIYARWNHEELGYISPIEFIQLAKKRELIDTLTQEVLNAGLPVFAEIAKRIPNLSLSVNISPVSFTHSDFLQRLLESCVAFDLAPSQIILEFPELEIYQNMEVFAESLMRYQRAGFRIALDDFGTGESNALMIEKLKLSEIKIDVAVIKAIKTSKEAEFLAKAALKLANQSGILATAEGVETEETMEHIKLLGFDMAQGYYIAHPMSASALEAWLRQHSHTSAQAQEKF
ncbi:EAL domain-containing protein [Aliidiomarina indica]|uniref:EAL domain-containing protein n=1 Tax=Aliidiomarina indica TaxID=2749147 RepID=UPI0018904C7B|nr:EAL domain-containing protein [Aliidiomarina indica]